MSTIGNRANMFMQLWAYGFTADQRTMITATASRTHSRSLIDVIDVLSYTLYNKFPATYLFAPAFSGFESGNDIKQFFVNAVLTLVVNSLIEVI
jgi:hypothetical protein